MFYCCIFLFDPGLPGRETVIIIWLYIAGTTMLLQWSWVILEAGFMFELVLRLMVDPGLWLR